MENHGSDSAGHFLARLVRGERSWWFVPHPSHAKRSAVAAVRSDHPCVYVLIFLITSALPVGSSAALWGSAIRRYVVIDALSSTIVAVNSSVARSCSSLDIAYWLAKRAACQPRLPRSDDARQAFQPVQALSRRRQVVRLRILGGNKVRWRSQEGHRSHRDNAHLFAGSACRDKSLDQQAERTREHKRRGRGQ